MPPLPPIPDTFRVTLKYSYGGDSNILNRFFMKYAGSISAGDATTMVGTVASSWATRMAPNTSPQCSLIQVSLNDMGSNTGVDVGPPVAEVGTGPDTGTVAGAAFIMSAHVALKYRGGHSRVYLPGMNHAGLADANTWTAAFSAAVSTAWTGILHDLAASPPPAVGALTQVAVHQYSSNLKDFGGTAPSTKPPPWPLTDPATIVITGWSANPQVGSQRRRNQQ